jgi:hypothetical protein
MLGPKLFAPLLDVHEHQAPEASSPAFILVVSSSVLASTVSPFWAFKPVMNHFHCTLSGLSMFLGFFLYFFLLLLSLLYWLPVY